MRALVVVAVVVLSGCASTTRTASVSHTVGIQAGQPVDITTTTHEQSHTEQEVPPAVTGFLGIVANLLTGQNIAAGGGIAVLVLGWLREAQHGKRHQDDADEGWGEFKKLALAEGIGSSASSASAARPLPPWPA